jgi:hypothetical protein
MRLPVARRALVIVLSIVTANAIGGGIYALRGAAGVPVEWLAGSAFSSYVVPGLILMIAVGGTSALAAVALLAHHRRGFDLAKLAGWVLVTWMVEQLVIIGFVSWLQPVTMVAAAAILVLAYRPDHQRRWRTI